MSWNRWPTSIPCAPLAWTTVSTLFLRVGRVGGWIALGFLLGYPDTVNRSLRLTDSRADRPPLESAQRSGRGDGEWGAIDRPRSDQLDLEWDQLSSVQTHFGPFAPSLLVASPPASSPLASSPFTSSALPADVLYGNALDPRPTAPDPAHARETGARAAGVRETYARETYTRETYARDTDPRPIVPHPTYVSQAYPRPVQSGPPLYPADSGVTVVPVSQGQSSLNVAVTPGHSTLTSPPFHDVPESYWATDFIVGLREHNLIQGFPDGSFRPNVPMTRAQFAVVLAQVFPSRRSVQALPFSDLSAQHWAAAAIAQVTGQGFLRGYPHGQFQPERSISRLEMLLALATGLNYVPQGSVDRLMAYYNDYSLVPIEAWAKIAAVTERGLVVSYPDPRFLNPNRPATRAEVAVVLYQALVSQGQATLIPSPYIVKFDPVALPALPAPAATRPAQ